VEEEIYCFRSIDIFTKPGCSLRSMDILKKLKYSSLQSMKRREGVFSPKAQKQYVCKKFHASQRSELKNSLHIRFKTIHIKYYILSPTNVTLTT
jgi:hypothetical protein